MQLSLEKQVCPSEMTAAVDSQWQVKFKKGLGKDFYQERDRCVQCAVVMGEGLQLLSDAFRIARSHLSSVPGNLTMVSIGGFGVIVKKSGVQTA